MVIHKTFSDFVLYLYIHIAYADGQLHADEERVVLEKMNRHFPIEGDHKARYDERVKEYNEIEKIIASRNYQSVIRAFRSHQILAAL
jgi:hypothetical protein